MHSLSNHIYTFLKSMKFIFLSMIQRRLIYVLKCDMRWYRIHPNIMIYVNVSYIGNAILCFVWMYVKCKWIIIPNSYILQKDKNQNLIFLDFWTELRQEYSHTSFNEHYKSTSSRAAMLFSLWSSIFGSVSVMFIWVFVWIN